MLDLSYLLDGVAWGRKFIKSPSRRGKRNVEYSRTYNNNNIFTFDTETTSIKHGDLKCSFVYICMLCINGTVFYSRTITEFKKFLDMYNPDDNTVNVIYVHNLGFDFQFLQNELLFTHVFARKAYKPIFGRYKNWEFRCSYFLTNMSLANLCKSYDLEHGKLTDFLDYRKIRHSETPLTTLELSYCAVDVLALYDFIKYMLAQYKSYREIPYTQTGFVGKFLLESAKTDKEYYKLRALVERTKPDLELYELFENCFAGGYTHANYMATASGYYTNVKSYDITSSYPSVMCRKKFPIGAFKKCVGSFWYYIDSDEYSCVGKFRLKNVQAKTNLCYLSEHKILKYVGDDGRKHSTMINGRVNNGRVFKADSLEICLTNVDIHTIKMMYDCEIEIIEMYVARADYLPKTIVKSILTLYGNKTKFKGVPEKSALYLSSKQMVNSVYGKSAFNPYCDNVIYDAGEWKPDAATPEKLWKYYDNRKTILPYQWGIFVTAWARFNLCFLASKIGNDVLYMDTDSIKFIGDYDALFTTDNAKIHAENIDAAKHFDFDFEMFAPVDIKGHSHELGLWDYEYTYKSFKCLGAKRYCYTLYHKDDVKAGNKHIYPVCAGANIPALRAYLMKHNCNALLRPFRLDLFMDKTESGKNSITYHKNHNIDIPVRDYLGNTKIVHIGHGCFLERTTFDMSFASDYMKFILNYAVSDKVALVRNGVICE